MQNAHNDRPQVDYSNYAATQMEWARLLTKAAICADADHSSELDLGASEAIRRVALHIPTANA